MKFLTFVCSLLIVTVAQDPALLCNYRTFGETYQCQLTINNSNGFDNFTEIGGIHLQGFTDADVNHVYKYSGTTINIPQMPQIICDTFPNIIDFEIFTVPLTEIGDNALRGCSHIKRLHLPYNRITSISENAFASLREVEYIDLSDNLLTTLPENVFGNQQNLTYLNFNWNSLNNLPSSIFRPLQSLQLLGLGHNNLDAGDNEWFTTNSNMYAINLSGNKIKLTEGSFPRSLVLLDLGYNGISEIPVGAFTGLFYLSELRLYGNSLREIHASIFSDLGQLTDLEISSNPIERIDDGAFQGLDSLISLSLSTCGIRDLDLISFKGLGNLTSINLNFNEIEEIPAGTFATMPKINYIDLWANRIKTLRRNSFGSLTELRTLDLGENIVNALDRAIIDDAVNLNTLFFYGNLCASNYFGNFLISRATYLPMLEGCFRNMRYIVDTTTDSDGIYSFFEGPHPGIVIRVRSDDEIQIALTSFNFMWTPSIEIFIGLYNNTRSVIRINEETDVVTVPTPNAIRPNQWNDFRVSWENQNVLVFRGNENFPFMSYTMHHFFPVNFYGLRAVEARATWSVSPLDN